MRDLNAEAMLNERLGPTHAPRIRYFQRGNGPMFIWTTEPMIDAGERRYVSVVAVPVGKGSRSGKATEWVRDARTQSWHVLRKDAKARALKLFREWEARTS